MKASTFTPQQKRVYDFIADYIYGHEYSPTYREIADGLDCKCATIFEHVEHMINKGLLHFTPRQARSLQLADMCPTCGRKKRTCTR